MAIYSRLWATSDFLVPSDAAHQHVLTFRHGGGPQTQTRPLTGLGEPSGIFGTRATHIVLKSCFRSGCTRSRITSSVLLIPVGTSLTNPSRLFIVLRKSKNLAKRTNSSASLCDRVREHMPFQTAKQSCSSVGLHLGTCARPAKSKENTRSIAR